MSKELPRKPTPPDNITVKDTAIDPYFIAYLLIGTAIFIGIIFAINTWILGV
jgi:hypothetical protein